MKKTLVLILSALLLLAVMNSGCVDDEEDDELVSIVVTIPPQKEWVENIGGDNVKITVMVPVGADPHTYEPTASQMAAVTHADIYFALGSNIEFEHRWMDTLIEYNQDMLIVDGSIGIELLELDDHHDEEHDHEDHDPHTWMSPVNVQIMIENFLESLVEVDPEGEQQYLENADIYVEKLETLHDEISDSLKNYSGRKFLIYHPALGYFAHEYGLQEIAIEYEGHEPGPSRLESVILQAKEENITVVFVSPQFDENNAEIIAEEIDGEVITLNLLSEEYMDNLRDITEKLVFAFEGN